MSPWNLEAVGQLMFLFYGIEYSGNAHEARSLDLVKYEDVIDSDYYRRVNFKRIIMVLGIVILFNLMKRYLIYLSSSG